jgi:hypothetical protein
MEIQKPAAGLRGALDLLLAGEPVPEPHHRSIGRKHDAETRHRTQPTVPPYEPAV